MHVANDLSPATALTLLVLTAIGLFILIFQTAVINNEKTQAEFERGAFRPGLYWEVDR